MELVKGNLTVGKERGKGWVVTGGSSSRGGQREAVEAEKG